METPDRRPALRAAPGPASARCAVGDTLCHVLVLSQAEWDALPEGRRPATAEYFPGLGWVVAAPRRLK